MASIDVLLQHTVRCGASDLHLGAGRPPVARLHGELEPIAGVPPLEEALLEGLLLEVMPERHRALFASGKEVDFSYTVPGVGRFRANIFRDTGGVCGAFRYLAERVPTFDELGLPEVVRSLCELKDGLVIVTGPTGCGKSTTLAALIDLVNKTRKDHIVTIEDPVEFIHKNERSFVNQREVHTHTTSFGHAIRAALREDPDVVLVGEMRDLETVESTIRTAETGHLVLSTLHTGSAIAAVDRMVEQFPAERQQQVRVMLAATLRAVLAQTLLRRKDGKGRVLAMEVLIVNSAIAANIRDGKTHLIQNALQTGGRAGMIPMNEAIARVVKEGLVTPAEGLLRALDKPDLERRLLAEGIPVPHLTVDKPGASGRFEPALRAGSGSGSGGG